jgi:predicted ATPase
VVGALASLITHRRLPDRVIATLMERTEGVPFFVEQMALAMMERGDLEKGGDDVPLPLTIEAAVQARLDSLPEAARDLCKRASILERPFLLDEVEALGAAPARAIGRMAPGAGEAEAFTCPMAPEEPAG